MLFIIFIFKTKGIIRKIKFFTKFAKTSIFITATLCGIMFTSMSNAMAYDYVRQHCNEDNMSMPIVYNPLLDNRIIKKLPDPLEEKLKKNLKNPITDKQLNKKSKFSLLNLLLILIIN